MSSTQLAISEIGVTFPDDTFGEESRFGVPFTVRPAWHLAMKTNFMIVFDERCLAIRFDCR